MRHLLDALKSVATVAKSFRRAPTTVQFPAEKRPRAERYRASFALLHEADGDEACIGCLQCERICPSKVIAVKGPAKRDSPITGKKRSYADDFTLDLSACIFCELCVQVCPTDAIVMTREQEEPAFGREDLVLTMPKLYANETSKTRAWGDGTKLMEMQTPPKPAVAAANAPGAASPATGVPPLAGAATTTPTAGPGSNATPAPSLPTTAPSATPSGPALASSAAPTDSAPPASTATAPSATPAPDPGAPPAAAATAAPGTSIAPSPEPVPATARRTGGTP